MPLRASQMMSWESSPPDAIYLLSSLYWQKYTLFWCSLRIDAGLPLLRSQTIKDLSGEAVKSCFPSFVKCVHQTPSLIFKYKDSIRSWDKTFFIIRLIFVSIYIIHSYICKNEILACYWKYLAKFIDIIGHLHPNSIKLISELRMALQCGSILECIEIP